MKKQLITLLMAGLLVVGFGGSALAAPGDVTGNEAASTSTMSVTEAIPVAWTINIPTTIKAGAEIPIKASNMVVGVGKSVKVNVEDAADVLTAGVLTLKNDDKSITTELSTAIQGGAKIGADGLVAEFNTIKNTAAGDTTEITAKTGGKIFTSKPVLSGAFAGDYSGTLTFNIAYGETTTP